MCEFSFRLHAIDGSVAESVGRDKFTHKRITYSFCRKQWLLMDDFDKIKEDVVLLGFKETAIQLEKIDDSVIFLGMGLK